MVPAPEFRIALSFNLLQLPRFRIDDEASHHDVLWYEWVGLTALLCHEGFVVFDNLVDHN